MTNRCNFDCEYCYVRRTPYPEYEPQDIDLLDQKIDESWKIIFTGGEPFLIPGFVDLCHRVATKHKIAIDTNLSVTSEVKKFVEAVRPEQIHYLYIACHIEQREKRNNLREFLENLDLLKRKGFGNSIALNYVLHPRLFDRLEKDREMFLDHGFSLSPTFMGGEFEGKPYPESYTPEQMAKFNIEKTWVGPFHSKGLLCKAGHTFFSMQPDGEIHRCECDTRRIGDLKTGFSLKETSYPCEIEICSCLGELLVEADRKEVLNRSCSPFNKF
jgi:MoaA/NifB/PqqE/SkfB family radical SAM enzyme